MAPLFRFSKVTDLNGYVLIIPSVSVGNVPQLTIDLLIQNFKLEKVASVWHPAIVAAVGSDPYDSKSSEICSACELYVNKNLKVACMQLRSTLDYKLVKKFLKDICTEIVALKLIQVLILSSAFDYELPNINKSRFYYLSNLEDRCRNIPDAEELNNDNGNYSLNGAGFALSSYEIISKCSNCILLGKYISEGDNRPDAFAMLDKVLNILEIRIESQKIDYPCSWAYVFGAPPPLGIY